MASAVRVLYPALAGEWQMSASEIGLLYAAIPLGAACGALTSGNLAQSARPGLIMLLATLASFIAIGFFSLMPVWALGVLCLVILRLAERHQLAVAVHPDPDPDAGRDARAHQRPVDRAERHGRCHWRGDPRGRWGR